MDRRRRPRRRDNVWPIAARAGSQCWPVRECPSRAEATGIFTICRQLPVTVRGRAQYSARLGPRSQPPLRQAPGNGPGVRSKGCSVDFDSKFSKMQRVETPKKGLRMRSPFNNNASSSIRDRISMQMHHDGSGKVLHEALCKVPSPMTPAKIRARRQSERHPSDQHPSQGNDFSNHLKYNSENLDPQKSSPFFSPICKAPKQLCGANEFKLAARMSERSEPKDSQDLSTIQDIQVILKLYFFKFASC